MAEGFLLGPGLLSQVRRTIDRVDGEAIGSGVRRIPTALEGEDALPAAKVFRICTFTGSWSVGDEKVVTFKYQTATPNTAFATNLFAAVPDPSGQGDCAIAKEGTSWFLIAAVCVTTET